MENSALQQCYGFKNGLRSAVNQSWICPIDENGTISHANCNFLYYQQYGRPSFCSNFELVVSVAIAMVCIPTNLMAIKGFYKARPELLFLVSVLAVLNIVFSLLTLLKGAQSVVTSDWQLLGNVGCISFATVFGSITPLQSWMLVLISSERRAAVVCIRSSFEWKQAKNTRLVRVSIIFVFLLGTTAFMVAPVASVVHVVDSAVVDDRPVVYCAVEEVRLVPLYSIQIFYTLASFVVPNIVIAINYLIIWKTVRRNSLSLTGKRRVLRQREVNMSYLMAGKVVMFFLCTLPVQVVLAIIRYEHGSDYKTVQSSAYWAANFLVNLRGAVDPILMACLIWQRQYRQRDRFTQQTGTLSTFLTIKQRPKNSTAAAAGF